jgi:hypothetical protein
MVKGSTISMKRFYFIFLLTLPIISGCEKMFEKPSWKTDVVAPLIKTTLGVEHILKDTSFKAQSDGSIKLVSREKLYDLNLDSIVQLEVTPFLKNVKLSTLKLDEQEITRRVSLGELALAMQANGDPNGSLILAFNGSYFPIPGMNDLVAGPLDVNINQFFEYAEMDDPGGEMDIKLENQLPVNITNVQFELKNKNIGTQITQQTYTNLNKNTSQTETVDLSNKIIEGNLVVNVLDMDIQGSGSPVLIDTSDAIIITLTIKNIKVVAATAVFPAQEVINENSENTLNGLGEVELTMVKIQSGMMEAEAYSTAEDTVYFTYKISSATIGSDTFKMIALIPPAPPGGTSYKKFTADFSGYTLNLKGLNGDKVNTFHNELKGSIEYTGRKVNLSLTDSIHITVRMVEAIPSYVEGYLGDSTINLGAGSVDLDIFSNIESGTLNFEDVNISLVIENGLGLEGTYSFNNVEAVNTKTGQQQSLNGLPISGSIGKAQDNGNSFTPAITTIDLNGTNAIDLLNIMPDKINYNVDLTYNPSGNPPGNDETDFAYAGASLNPYLEIELPLSIIANQLVLSDTADFASENFQTSVNSGTFSIHVANGFPLNGNLKLYFLDQGNSVIDSVIASGGIIEAPVDGANRVIQKMPSRMSFYVNETKMQNIMRSRKVVFKVQFSTVGIPANSYVKIYSDYEMDFTLVGDFNYTIK